MENILQNWLPKIGEDTLAVSGHFRLHRTDGWENCSFHLVFAKCNVVTIKYSTLVRDKLQYQVNYLNSSAENWNGIKYKYIIIELVSTCYFFVLNFLFLSFCCLYLFNTVRFLGVNPVTACITSANKKRKEHLNVEETEQSLKRRKLSPIVYDRSIIPKSTGTKFNANWLPTEAM